MTLHHPLPKTLLYALLLAVLLTACASTQNAAPTSPPAPTAASTASPVLPSGTPTPAPTAGATRAPTATRVPPKPTRTATAEPALLPTLPAIKDAASYTLATPAPVDLLDQIALASILSEVQSSPASESGAVDQEVLGSDAENLRDTLDEELDLYYPGHLPDPSLIRKYYPLEQGNFYFVPDAYFDLLSGSVFEEISNGAVSLSLSSPVDNERYTIEAYSVELDHDPAQEWLARITWKATRAVTWLALDQNADGSYRRLPSGGFPNISSDNDFDSTIGVLKDFTGDGITDGVYQDFSFLGGTEGRNFYVIKGSPDGFHNIGRVWQLASGNTYDAYEYEIKIPPEVPVVTITLRNPHSLSWGCSWDTVETYRWPDGVQQKTVQGAEPPDTPECRLARAVRVDEDPPGVDESIRLLESAVRALPQDAPTASFAHYRLSILHALAGSDALARQHFTAFIDHYQQPKPFLEKLLKPMLAQEPFDPIAVCNLFLPEITQSHSFQTIPEGWLDYISVGSVLDLYPYVGVPYEPAVCPIENVLVEKLKTVYFDPAQSPETALKAAGVPVVSAHPYVYDRQQPPAWFVLLYVDEPFVAGYVPQPQGEPTWQVLTRFTDASSSEPEVFSEDATGDGFPEIAFYTEPVKEDYVCKTDIAREILMVTSFGSGFISVPGTFCSPPSDQFDVKDDLLVDRDGDHLVDWAIDEMKSLDEGSFFTIDGYSLPKWFSSKDLDEMIEPAAIEDQDLLHSAYQSPEPAQARAALVRARDQLPKDQPYYHHNGQRLTYLIAITYAREGKTEQAVEAFVSILNNPPQTIWANLAWIHLSEKP